ncbi:hypothetical protein JCM10207_002996 [Rhodosporidiobolus poonsookiae]
MCCLACCCTVRLWVIVQALIFCAGYFAACWGLRYIGFPVLKSLFEDFTFYNLSPLGLRDPVHSWIFDDVEPMFYYCLWFCGIGFAGVVGAAFSIGILLIPYAIYLLGTWAADAWKLWQVLQAPSNRSGIIGSIFGVDFDESFARYKNYSYIAFGVVVLLFGTTFICVIILLKRIHHDTGSCFFTCCGHACGCGKHKHKDDDSDADNEKDLEKALPGRRQRRQRSALLFDADADAASEKRAGGAESVPEAAFSLPRASKRRAASRASEADRAAATFSLGRLKGGAVVAGERRASEREAEGAGGSGGAPAATDAGFFDFGNPTERGSSEAGPARDARFGVSTRVWAEPVETKKPKKKSSGLFRRD